MNEGLGQIRETLPVQAENIRAATNECCADQPMPASQFRQVKINRVANGFVLEIGCKTLVAKTWDEAADGLREYWKDPVAAEKKYCAA